MIADQFLEAISLINNLSTIASIACIVPTYFLPLDSTRYPSILSLAIVLSLSTSLIETCAIFMSESRDPEIATFLFVAASPLSLILIAILLRMKHVVSAIVWSSVGNRMKAYLSSLDAEGLLARAYAVALVTHPFDPEQGASNYLPPSIFDSLDASGGTSPDLNNWLTDLIRERSRQ